jgi:predicted transposase/invertase (TIGR01784 family)
LVDFGSFWKMVSPMPVRYLDPKNDIVFKKIFGEHPKILKSFLNGLLPLGPGELITELEYLPIEQVPEVPLLKNSSVDVKCTDEHGRIFIVQMQLCWTTAFMQRVLFNASKAYVRQLPRGDNYSLLRPVMGLSIVDAVMDPKTVEYYHHYRLVNIADSDKVIEGLQLVFIELAKFQPKAEEQQQLRDAWLQFLRDTGNSKLTSKVTAVAPEIAEAMALATEASFTPAELEAYDKYWDAVSSERTLIGGAKAEGLAEGEARGEAKEILKGQAIGRSEERSLLRQKLMNKGMSEAEIEELLARDVS